MPRVVVNQGAPGTTELVAAVLGRTVKVTRVIITLSANGTLKFTDGTDDLCGPMDVAQYGGFVVPTDIAHPWFAAGAGRAFNVVTTGGSAHGLIDYFLE